MNRTEVEVVGINKATQKEREAFILAAEWYETALNSKDFWAVVQSKYSLWEDKMWLRDKGRYQNFSEFKEMVLDGSNKFFEEKDRIIQIKVAFYYSFRSVVGYTTPSTWWTWINRNVFKGFDIGDIAGNQAHEELHNEGLDHPGTNKLSVVYKFGYELRDWVKSQMRFPIPTQPTPITIKRSLWQRVLGFLKRIF